jgi:F-type H+-transporting ATPase subunit gamma
MAVNAKAIKGRIKSVKNTQKMTRAMEMVSAAKMRKSTEASMNTRRYATLAHELMHTLSALEDPNYPLLELRPIERVLVILVSSNRGLCGSYNSNVFKKTKQILLNDDLVGVHRTDSTKDIPPKRENPEIHIVGVGKKSAQFAKMHGYTLDAVFDTVGDTPSYDDMLPIAQFAIDGFVEKTYDRVMIAYTHFVTTLAQEVKMRQLMPISSKDLVKMIDEVGDTKKQSTDTVDDLVPLGEGSLPLTAYTFEPNIESVLEYILPKLVEVQIYQALLESAASEHSSRMIAMKNATDNAGDMVKELTLTYNKARQAAITQEIAEIVGGAAALE